MKYRFCLLCVVIFLPIASGMGLTSKVALRIQHSPEQQRTELTLDKNLQRGAQEKAAVLSEAQLCAHEYPAGDWPNAAARRTGFRLHSSYRVDANHIESLVCGITDPELVAPLLWASEGHRQHVFGLEEFFAAQNRIGVGYDNGYFVIWIAREQE